MVCGEMSGAAARTGSLNKKKQGNCKKSKQYRGVGKYNGDN